MTDSVVIDALTMSGPAGGAVVVLGWLVRGWLISVRSDLTGLSTMITDLRERVARLEAHVSRNGPRAK